MVSDATKKASKSYNPITKNIGNFFGACILIVFALWVIFYASELYYNGSIGKGVLLSNKCWVPEGRRTCAPQFIIAGAMKSGTTSLWSYLQNHPHVLPLSSQIIDPQGLREVTAQKEVRFFNDPGYSQLVNEYGKSAAINYYLDIFPIIPPPNVQSNDLMLMTNQGRITGEATPMYISSLGVAGRIKEALPFVKIIVLLRNPIDRAYSDYWFRKNLKITDQRKAERFELQSYTHSQVFEKCVENEIKIAEICDFASWAENPTKKGAEEFWNCAKKLAKQVNTANLLSPICSEGSRIKSLCLEDEIRKNCQPMGLLYGIYAPQMLEWMEIFDSENLFISPSEIMFDSPSEFMDDISDYLELESYNWDSVTKNTFNIMNPNSIHGSKLESITNANKQLQIGKSDTTSEYPPLDEQVRVNLIKLLKPFNEVLVNIVGNDLFLDWNKL